MAEADMYDTVKINAGYFNEVSGEPRGLGGYAANISPY
jgi:hypothetical protein